MKKKDLLAKKSVEELKRNRERLRAGRAILLGFMLLAALVLIDQFTKIAADMYFAKHRRKIVPIIPEWIYLEMDYNPGIAYGGLADASAGVKIAIIAGTAVLMLLFTVLYARMDRRRSFLRIALLFIVAGGIGNLIDRVQYKVWELDSDASTGVRDMINLERFGFAVCNLADFFITGGAAMLVLGLLFFDRDALFPTGKKYKALAQEHEDKKNELVEVKGNRAAEDYEPRTDETDNE